MYILVGRCLFMFGVEQSSGGLTASFDVAVQWVTEGVGGGISMEAWCLHTYLHTTLQCTCVLNTYV